MRYLGQPRILGMPLGTGSRGQFFANYVKNVLQPVMYLPLTETSGTPVSYGTLTGLTISQTNCTQGVAGLLGDPHAYEWNATNSRLIVNNNAGFQGLTAFTLWTLVNPDGAGENNNGVIAIKTGEFELRFNSASRDLIAIVYYTGGNAETITTTTLPTGTWSTVSAKINNTTKTIRIFINGVEASYSGTPTAGISNRVGNTNAIYVGNQSDLTKTWDGLEDEVILFNSELADAVDVKLAQLAGVA